MPVRTIEQAQAATQLGGDISQVLFDIVTELPVLNKEWAGVRHPEMLEEIHWDLTQIRGRLRLAVTGEYDAI